MHFRFTIARCAIHGETKLLMHAMHSFIHKKIWVDSILVALVHSNFRCWKYKFVNENHLVQLTPLDQVQGYSIIHELHWLISVFFANAIRFSFLSLSRMNIATCNSVELLFDLRMNFRKLSIANIDVRIEIQWMDAWSTRNRFYGVAMAAIFRNVYRDFMRYNSKPSKWLIVCKFWQNEKNCLRRFFASLFMFIRINRWTGIWKSLLSVIAATLWIYSWNIFIDSFIE